MISIKQSHIQIAQEHVFMYLCSSLDLLTQVIYIKHKDVKQQQVQNCSNLYAT